MPQVLLRDLDRHTACDRMTCMRMPRPVRARLRKPLRALRVALPSQHVSTARKKRLDLVVERRRCDSFTPVEPLARVQAGRPCGGIAGLAEQERPLIADVLRVGVGLPSICHFRAFMLSSRR